MQPQSGITLNPFARSHELFGHLCDRLQGREALGSTHVEIEEVLSTDGREVMRQLFQDHLDLRGAHEQERPHALVVGEDGIRRPHRRDSPRILRALPGDVIVPRISYGQRGESSRFPMDAALNLPNDPFSLGVRYAVAFAVASKSYEESALDIEKTTGVHVAKRQCETLARAAAVDYCEFYRQRMVPSCAQSSSLLILTTDAKGIVVRTEDLRAATKRAAKKHVPKLKTRLTRGEKKHAKRMAQVAAVYTVAPFVRTAEDIIADLIHDPTRPRQKRPKPEDKRAWASVADEMRTVIGEAFDEADRRDPERDKCRVVLLDGNKDQLSLIQEEARQRGVSIIIIVDFIHVLGYLWAASTAFHGETSSSREDWVLERLGQILRGKAVDVAAGMRRSATLRSLDENVRRSVDDCADYLLNHKQFLQYDKYLSEGFPIASGVIEGACRHLVKDRMDLSGAHWSLAGAEAVLQLRALRASGDFDAYWEFHKQREFDRNHAARYSGPIPMPARPAARATLRLVKA